MRASDGPFAPPNEAGEADRRRAGQDAGRRTLPPEDRAGLAELAVAGLSAGIAPSQPSGGQPGTAERRNDACYWCGVYLSRGTPCWRYEPDRQRHRAVAHPHCHADAMGEP